MNENWGLIGCVLLYFCEFVYFCVSFEYWEEKEVVSCVGGEWISLLSYLWFLLNMGLT